MLRYTVPYPYMGHPVAMNIFYVEVRTVTFSHYFLYVVLFYCGMFRLTYKELSSG